MLFSVIFRGEYPLRVKGRAKGRAVEVDETKPHSVGMAKEDA